VTSNYSRTHWFGSAPIGCGGPGEGAMMAWQARPPRRPSRRGASLSRIPGYPHRSLSPSPCPSTAKNSKPPSPPAVQAKR
jgi:hypothetical protein